MVGTCSRFPDIQARARAEGLRQRRRVPSEHVWPVVVVHGERAFGFEVGPHGLEGFSREQEALEPQRSLPRDQDERVRKSEEDEVILPIAPLEERSAILDVITDPRVLIGPVRVALSTEPLEDRVDLDGVDVPRASGEREGDVVAGAGPDDEHLVQRVVRDVTIRVAVEGLFLHQILHGPDGLVWAPVHEDRRSSVALACFDVHSIVGRPEVAGDLPLHAEQGGRQRERHPLARCRAPAERRSEEEGDREYPGDRGQSEDRGDREEDDPEDASDDVESVGMQGTEGGECASDAGRRGHHDERDEDEDQWQGEPHGERWPAECAMRGAAPLPHGEHQDEGDGEEQEEGQ